MGMVIAPFFVPEKLQIHHVKGKEATLEYMFQSAIIITIMNIGTILFFKDKPEYPPSAAAEEQSDKKQNYSMRKDALLLIKNKNYILLVIVFSMLFGVYCVLGAIIDDLANSFKFDSR